VKVEYLTVMTAIDTINTNINRLREKYFYQLFRAGIFLKGVFSLIEIFAGAIVLLVTPLAIGSAIIHISRIELAEEPGSFFALHTLHLAQQFSLTPRAFLAIYLLSRGAIKFGLVIALLKNKLWAYPLALVVMGVFIAYQLYRMTVAYSLPLIVLTVFDLVVLWLIWHEYRLVRKHVNPAVIR
jgi:uncharacterized membrane protein